MSELKRTVLYDAHVAAGATMVDFGGWEMPIQYPSGIVTEHLTTRSGCGIFDVSHMGRLLIEGPDRLAFMQYALSSNVAAVKPGRAQYCMIPNTTGGAVDDAYVYMYDEDRYMLVVNASNTDKDLAHFATILPQFNCTVTNMTDKCASIAVQGPESDKILAISGEFKPVPKKTADAGAVARANDEKDEAQAKTGDAKDAAAKDAAPVSPMLPAPNWATNFTRNFSPFARNWAIHPNTAASAPI